MKKIKETISRIMKDTSDGSSISYNQDKDIFYSKKKKSLIRKIQFQIFLLMMNNQIM